MGNYQCGSDKAIHYTSGLIPYFKSKEGMSVVWLAIDLKYQQPFARIYWQFENRYIFTVQLPWL